MDITRYITSLNAALVGGSQNFSPEVRTAAERLAQGVEPALRLAFMEMAADIAAEVTARLDGEVVDVRLRGGNPEIVVDRRAALPDEPALPAPPPVPTQVEDDGGTARISLRLPDALKAQVDEAAAAAGVSVNTWLIRAVLQGLSPGGTGPDAGRHGRGRAGRTMTGWVR